SLLRRPQPDPTRPHARPPHGPALSSALLFYYWVDFLVGHLVKIRPAKTRSSLVVLERGWWDFLVDPARYRLAPPKQLVRILGALLPQPDLVIVLDAPAGTLGQRKGELSEDELERQRLAWRQVPATTAIVDATPSFDQVLAA